MDISFLHRLGTAYKNVITLIGDRGYDISNVVQFDDPLEWSGWLYNKAKAQKCSLGEAMKQSFKGKRGTLTLCCIDKNYDIAKAKERMVSMDQIKSFRDMIESHSTPDHRWILLVPFKLSPQAKKETIDAQIYMFDELLINIPKHDLVVPHIVVSEENVKKILGQTLNISDLPILPTDDPVSKWYDFQAGQIVFIKNPTMPSFRIVK
jgi:DNA-directed RNA polymerase subunit H (RpoH/RPB5)